MTERRIIVPLLVLAMILSVGAMVLSLRQIQQIRESVVNRPNTIMAGTQLNPPKPISDFTLPASIGGNVSLSDWQGKWVLMFFGYTHCPDVCPTTLTEYKRVMELINSYESDVQVVFVSVDGLRDTPERLEQYIAHFDERFIGLSGSQNVLDILQTELGFFYEVREEIDSNAQIIDHTAYTYLINPMGELTAVYSFGTPPQEVANSLIGMIESS